MPGVFEDLVVLDLSWGIAGPMTTMLLADNGAQVTRIEPPEGDPFRLSPDTGSGTGASGALARFATRRDSTPFDGWRRRRTSSSTASLRAR